MGEHTTDSSGSGRGRTRWLLPALLLCAVPVGGARAEPVPLESRDDPRYSADVLVFHEEDREKALVWLTVHCPVSSLFFEPDSARTDVRLAWKVRRGRRQIDGDVLVRQVNVDEEDREEAAVLQTIPVRLPPGRYAVEIELGQAGAETGSVVERDIEIDDIQGDVFSVSTLYLSAERPSRLGKREGGGLPGFPLVRRVVSQDVRHVNLVGEIYAPGGCQERFHVAYRLVDEYDRTLQEREEEIPCEGFRTPLVLPLDTTELVFGDYHVEVTVETKGTRDEVFREIWFAADETLLALRHNFKRTIEVIEPIATPEELSSMREALPGTREELWDEFWLSRDPDPETVRNEYKQEFFVLLRYANQQFGTGTTRGWKTDRGFTLLKYGHPDRIQRSNRSSFGSDVRAVERWEYYDEGLTLTFIDDIGLGDYRLVESTRG